MTRARIGALGATLVLAIALLGGEAGATAVAFSSPVMVNPPDGQGYEPSIKIDSAGTIFITAHKNSLVAETGRLNSWLWRSADGGRTFQGMPGGELFYALEGDFAIDGTDRLYFADTYAGDNHFASWTNHGTTLERYRPYTTTPVAADDRPWLTAHHDGLVYLLVNNGYGLEGRLELFRSTDRGASFSTDGFVFPRSGWGTPAADPRGDFVYVAANDKFYDGPTGLVDATSSSLSIWISADRARTWEQRTIASYEHSDPDGYPVVVVDAAGNVFVLWADGPPDDDPSANGSRLKLSRSGDHGETWETFDITPPELRYNDLFWLAADPTVPGLLGIGWNASTAAERTGETRWSLNAGIIQNAQSGTPTLHWSEVDPVAVVDDLPPQDFLQVAFSPDHRLSVTWNHWMPREPGGEVFSDIYFAQQTAGPNLIVAPVCKAKTPHWSNGKPKCRKP